MFGSTKFVSIMTSVNLDGYWAISRVVLLADGKFKLEGSKFSKSVSGVLGDISNNVYSVSKPGISLALLPNTHSITWNVSVFVYNRLDDLHKIKTTLKPMEARPK